MLLGIRWGSLRAKMLIWTFVPTIAILLAVGLVALQAFRRTAESLAVDRDRELARLYAGEVSSRLERYADALASIGRDVPAVARRGDVEGETLRSLRARLTVFDAGVALLDASGAVLAAEPPTMVPRGTDWSTRSAFRSVVRTGRPVYTDIHAEPGIDGDVVSVWAPILGESGAFIGAAAGMLHIDAERRRPLHDEIAALPLGERSTVYIVDGSGRAVFHSDAARTGSDLSARPLVTGLSASGAQARRARGEDGRDVLASSAPIPGTGWAMVAEEDWRRITADSRSYAQLLLVLLCLGVVVPAIVVTAGVRRITHPIGELIEAAQEVAKGHFGRTISADTGDEIEQLARQFNAMSAELEASVRELEERVQDRTRELAMRTEAERRRAEQFRVIANVGRQMSAILPLDELLEQIAHLLQGAFGYDHVGIALVEGEYAVYRAGAGKLWASACAGDGTAAFAFRPGRLRVGEEGLTGWVAGTGDTIVARDVRLEPRYVPMGGSATLSEFVVPIRTRSEVIGVIDVQSDRVAGFDDSDVEVIQSLANFAAIAIDNARLYERGRALAVLEERQRVARELHDSVTQGLYGVTLYADAAMRLLGVGELAAAREHVAQLRETARAALYEMRLLIFEMRPPEIEKVGLVAALQARLDAVEGRAGCRTELLAEEGARATPEVEDALYRIAQEALNNALKHAHARAAVVTLRVLDGCLRMEIVDDGVGFAPDEIAGRGGMGMRSMAERAAAVGGRLSVSSAPGKGTRVCVEVTL